MKFIFKLENSMLPAYLTNSMNIRQSDRHNHNTRNANEPIILRDRIVLLTIVFVFEYLKFVVIHLMTSKTKFKTLSLDGFIKYVKMTYLDKYRFECFIANCPICPRYQLTYLKFKISNLVLILWLAHHVSVQLFSSHFMQC